MISLSLSHSYGFIEYAYIDIKAQSLGSIDDNPPWHSLVQCLQNKETEAVLSCNIFVCLFRNPTCTYMKQTSLTPRWSPYLYMFLASDVILAVVIITSPSSTCYCQVLVYFIFKAKFINRLRSADGPGLVAIVSWWFVIVLCAFLFWHIILHIIIRCYYQILF